MKQSMPIVLYVLMISYCVLYTELKEVSKVHSIGLWYGYNGRSIYRRFQCFRDIGGLFRFVGCP